MTRETKAGLLMILMLAGVFGALSGVAGALISVSDANLPTGPMVILSLTVIVIISILFAPQRGIVWRRLASPTLKS